MKVKKLWITYYLLNGIKPYVYDIRRDRRKGEAFKCKIDEATVALKSCNKSRANKEVNKSK